MIYTVDLGGTTVSVAVDADGALLVTGSPRATVRPVPGTPLWVLTIGADVHELVVERTGPGRVTLTIDGYRVAAEAIDERTRAVRAMAATTAVASGPAPLRAPMPGLIVRVQAAVGDRVAAGATLIVMEAMKMENELRAPGGGVVRAVRVAPGTAVEKGAILVELDP